VREWLHFGPYRLDVSACALFRETTAISIPPKAIDILRVLAEAEGAVVTKETLFEEVWADTFVEESSITKNISELRSALGCNGATRYIETFPRRGYRLSVPVRRITEDGARDKKSLAVLPFRVLSEVGEPSIGLRLADALITALAKTKALAVLPTGAVSEAHGNRARELGADLTLDCSVQESGGRLRVTAQLLDSRTEQPIWGESLDSDAGDLFAAQNSLAEELAAALVMRVLTEEQVLLDRRYTERAEAYGAYLRGRFHWSQRSEKGLRTGIQWFRKAIGLDSGYAPAYSGLAASYALVPMLSAARATDFMPKARSAAVRALDLDEGLVEARTALAFVRWHYEFDWRRAEREFKRILEFRPEHAVTHQWYVLLLAEMGRVAEAVAEAKRASSLKPQSAAVCANRATVLLLSGRFAESIEVAREALQLDAGSLRAQWVLGTALEAAGQLEQAILVLEEAHRVFRGAPQIPGSLGHAYAAAGRVRDAATILEWLRERLPRRSRFDEALVELGLGKTAEALTLLKGRAASGSSRSCC
jgi:DNA-binding winged helix-turn-helix (wHTH) protein/tetratricopeptide (TPR) repeat protein